MPHLKIDQKRVTAIANRLNISISGIRDIMGVPPDHAGDVELYAAIGLLAATWRKQLDNNAQHDHCKNAFSIMYVEACKSYGIDGGN